MRRALVLIAVLAACGGNEHLVDGPPGLADAPGADGAGAPDAVPIDAAPPADAPPTLPLIVQPTPLDLGLVLVGQPTAGFVTFDNNSGADVVLTDTTVNGGDYALVNSTCVGAIADQTSCRVDVQLIPSAIGTRTGHVVVAGPGGIATADLTGEGGGLVTVVITGAGNGTVFGTGGIACPGTCTGVMSTGAVSATPTHASTFISWDDPGCGTSTSCNVTATIAPRTITATFGHDVNARRLTVQIAGTGKGVVGITSFEDAVPPCTGPSCEYWFLPGDFLGLDAIAASNFGGWSGPCSGTAVTCNFVGMVNTTVTATFNADPHEVLTILRPITGTAYERAADFDPSGNLVVTDGVRIATYDVSGAELSTTPVVPPLPVGGLVVDSAGTVHEVCCPTDVHEITAFAHRIAVTTDGVVVSLEGATVNPDDTGIDEPYAVDADNSGGKWIVGLRPDGAAASAQHFDAAGTLLTTVNSASAYHARVAVDPTTGVPVFAGTGNSHWTVNRNGVYFLNEDDPDYFSADIKNGVAIDSTGAIIAARADNDVSFPAVGIVRLRFAPDGTLVESVRHAAHPDYGLSVENLATGPDGLVAFVGELTSADSSGNRTRYEWIQILDYVP